MSNKHPELRASPYARKLIKQFENATRMHEMKGTSNPDYWDDIEEYYNACKQRLIQFVAELQQNDFRKMP